MRSNADHPALRRWFGVGTSNKRDSAVAGRDAAKAALAGADPRLLVVFASVAHDLQALVDAIGDASGDVPLVGCSTAGEIAGTGASDAGVVVVALGGPGFRACTAIADVVDGDLRRAAADAVRAAPPSADHGERVVLLLSDGLAGDQQEVIRGAYEVAGAAIPLVGGCAGDDLAMATTHQLHGRDVRTGSVVAVGLASDGPIGIGVRHGWRRVGEPMLVTGADGNRVTSLDGRPALDQYLDRLGAPADITDDPEAFTRFTSTHPLGVARRSGEEARFVAGADLADRSLACIAEVPEGGLTWLMQGDARLDPRRHRRRLRRRARRLRRPCARAPRLRLHRPPRRPR